MKAISLFLLGSALAVSLSHAAPGFSATERDGRIEVRDGDKLVFGWQYEPLRNPVGGAIFAGSAFVHPLCTPSGFDLTRIQPADHLHHYGVWWPWKILKVKGKKHITWEMQQNEGRHIAVAAKIKSRTADEVLIEAENRSEIKDAGKAYLPVTAEHATLRFSRLGEDAYALDVLIEDRPVKGMEVEVSQYSYSGFSWRGAASWNKDNSTMATSGGHHRDNANGEEVRWISVAGETDSGKATMLMMSGAAKDGCPPERARVWDSKAEHGAPFANFNPVVKKSLPLKAGQKEVSSRRYRLIVADRVIDATEAETLWKNWK